MERENRIAEARLSDAETAAVPGPLPASGASKDNHELLMCETKYYQSERSHRIGDESSWAH